MYAIAMLVICNEARFVWCVMYIPILRCFRELLSHFRKSADLADRRLNVIKWKQIALGHSSTTWFYTYHMYWDFTSFSQAYHTEITSHIRIILFTVLTTKLSWFFTVCSRYLNKFLRQHTLHGQPIAAHICVTFYAYETKRRAFWYGHINLRSCCASLPSISYHSTVRYHSPLQRFVHSVYAFLSLFAWT